MYGANLCVFNKSAKDVQHGAFLFMKYLTSEAVTTKWAQTTSYMPVRQSAYTALQNSFYKDNPTQAVAPTMLSKGYLFALPVTPSSNEQRDALTTELNNIAAGRVDPKTGLDRAAAKMNDIMATG
jgi:multiple sugar transport system substrate-binding protein